MNYKFLVKTKVFYGENSLKDNNQLISDLGRTALICTGKNSGKKSGALDDIIKILNDLSINYHIFDGIENNPSTDNVVEASNFARKNNADFVIGIGGGSPLDASKAIATLTVNDIDVMDLFKNSFINKPLPIIAIPTTAGTGSEVTPYSILTRNDLKTKMSFGNDDTFPVYAFNDPVYSMSMNDDTTIDTAVDAFSHSLEGYLSKRCTPLSDVIALEAFRIFSKNIKNITNKDFDLKTRDELLYMSMLGGMVISQTGTTILHGMGYSLTYFKNVPHGRANGLLMKEYLSFMQRGEKNRVKNMLSAMNMASVDEFGEYLDKMIGFDGKIDSEELKTFVEISLKQRSLNYTNITPGENDIKDIFTKSLGIHDKA